MSDELRDSLDTEPGGEEMFTDLGRFETGAIPVDAVVKRGKAIRTRRRTVAGGMLAVAAALAIGVPVAVAGGGSGAVAATSGHRILVNRAQESANHTVSFSGSIDGKAWTRTLPSAQCGQRYQPPGCLYRMAGADKRPVGELMKDDTNKEGDFYLAQFGPETAYVVMTLNTGDRVTVPGVVLTDGYRAAYFELPRHAMPKKIVAYTENGQEIGYADNISSAPREWSPLSTWYRPDGGELDTSVPKSRVASGTSGGVSWSVDVTIGVYDRCYAAQFGINVIDDCTNPAVHVQSTLAENTPAGPSPATTFVYGRVDAKTTRVDVTFKDGTVEHLTPVRTHGEAFVATYVPQGRTVASVTPVTGTNG